MRKPDSTLALEVGDGDKDLRDDPWEKIKPFVPGSLKAKRARATTGGAKGNLEPRH